MQTYSFLDVTATLIGPGGFIGLGAGAGAAEEGISVDPSTEIDVMQIGADGSGMHSLIADRSGKITVRLLRNSPRNRELSAMYEFQTASGSAHGQNTLTITNQQTGEVITCQQVAFAKAPPVSFGREAMMLEWEFNAVTINRVLGAL